jgi:hypothetical protein
VKLGCSNTAATAVNLEADASARLPKGMRAVFIFAACNDSGSAAATALYLYLRASATSGVRFIVSVAGLANDAIFYTSGWQPCGYTGDFDYVIVASGAGTFDIKHFRYEGVMV